MKTPAIICDLDGTLCNTERRAHFLEQKKKDWDSFYEAMSDDPPYSEVAQFLQALRSMTNSAESKYPVIIFCTGRPDKYKQETTKWLRIHLGFALDSDYKLCMRKTGDHRPDTAVKKELLEQIKQEYQPILAIEDRTRVVNAWREWEFPACNGRKMTFKEKQ